MITTKQLIQLAPFPEDAKKELLEKADAFSSRLKCFANFVLSLLNSPDYYPDFVQL